MAQRSAQTLFEPPKTTLDPRADTPPPSDRSAEYSIDSTSVMPGLRPVPPKIQREKADDSDTPPSPVQAPPPPPGTPGQSGDQLSAGATGSTNIVAPAVSSKIYSGKTLKDVADAMPAEPGALSFAISTVADNDPITKATVTVRQTMEMPRWAERDKQCKPIQAAWDRFIGALQKHEAEHDKINRQQLGSAHERYIGHAQSETQDVTTELENEAIAAGQAFDTQTDHGKTGSPPTIIDLGAKCDDKTTSIGTDEEDFLQMKLEVSEPGDPDEEEADRIADQVMRMEEPGGGALRVGSAARVVQRCAACDTEEEKWRAAPPLEGQGRIRRQCAECAAKERKEEENGYGSEGEEEEKKKRVKRKRANERSHVDASSRVIGVTRSGGAPLDPDTRAFMEPRFGFDFSSVRIHADSQAADAARSVNAHAYTLGSSVVFGAGKFAPASDSGRRLLAHELAHVVQQSGGPAVATVRRSPAGNKAIQAVIDSGDPAGIDGLETAPLQLATPDQKIALIRLIVDKNGPTARLELLWNNLKDPVVEANVDLWKATWAKHASLMGNHPRKTQFTRDVADLANAMLTESEGICAAYLDHYGLSKDSDKPGQSTPERDKSISAVQDKATEVLGAQSQLKRLWTIRIPTDRKYLGPRSMIEPSVAFQPDRNPNAYSSPEGEELWRKTDVAVKDLTSAIDGYLEAFPELYPLVMGGQSSKKDAYSDTSSMKNAAEKPLDAIEQGLRKTIENIKASRGPTVEILARERKLRPVEDQLLGGRLSPGSTRNWQSGPIWSAMVPAITEKPGLLTAEAGLMFALQIAVAVGTGGIGNLLMSGAQAALSHAEAGVIQTASDTSLGGKNAIVSKQEVAAAKLAAKIDLAFLVFDLVPGMKEARGAWSAARGAAHAVEKSAAELAQKALTYEAKLMAKAEKAELETLLKAMEQEAGAARKSLDEAKAAAAKASEGEKTLAEAEVKQATAALERAEGTIKAVKALETGEALIVEMGGKRFSWVQGRGLVICASPCAGALTWFWDYGKKLVDDATKHSPLAGEMVSNRAQSARQHLTQIEQSLMTASKVDQPTFNRAVVHANSVIAEVEAQAKFAELRFPAAAGAAAGQAITNQKWAEDLLAHLKMRKEAIEKTDKAFYGTLGEDMRKAAEQAHAAEWENKLGKVADPSNPKSKVSGLIKQVEDYGKSASTDPNQRAILMENIDKALTNYERELRGQRDLVLSGAELKAFTDEGAGKLLFPGLSEKALKGAKKPDYIAEIGNRIVIGDSKGAGDVVKAMDQIRPAFDSDYVREAIRNGKIIECRVFLDYKEATAKGYVAIANALYQIVDGKAERIVVTTPIGSFPLYVSWN
jgi:hypothetical protein